MSRADVELPSAKRFTLWVLPTEGFAVSSASEPQSPSESHAHAHEHIPAPGEPSVPEIEEDENVAPRPEEDIADVLRAKPDTEDHSHHAE